MSIIISVHARQIFDSRGNPTVEVDVTTENGVVGRAAVPSGASTGEHEAVELRDGGADYMGKSVYNALDNVNKIISQKIIGTSVFEQESIDNVHHRNRKGVCILSSNISIQRYPQFVGCGFCYR